LDDDVDDRAGIASVLSIIVGSKEAEFLNSVGPGFIAKIRSHGNLVVISSIEREVVSCISGTINAESAFGADTATDGNNTGLQEGQVHDVAPVERQALDSPVFDSCAERARLAIEQFLAAGHGHLLGDSGGGQRDIQLQMASRLNRRVLQCC